MLKTKEKERGQYEMICIEELVPEDHILRKIDAAIDFTHIYELVGDMYCPNNGRPSVDPVVLFKMILIQHLFGITSLRKTAEEVKLNVAYRWFLGYLLNEQTPHFSTLSHNLRNRYAPEVVEAVFVDGTHIKANANTKKVIKKAVPKAARIYEEQLMKEINEEREKNGKKPFDGPKPLKEKETVESTTDPDRGVFHKGEHKKCMAYTVQTACDKHGYVMDVTVNPGNVHDSTAFNGLYDRLVQRFPEIYACVMDAGYKTPWICKKITDDGRIPVLPYKRPMGARGFFRPYEYVYDEYYNCVICPENQVLNFSTINRDGYREFKSNPQICEKCPSRKNCTNSKKYQKTVTKHIWSEYIEYAEDIRHTPKYKKLYEKRKETIERVFADAKEKYGMRYTLHRGLSHVTNWVRLKFAAMNLKKFAIRRWNKDNNLRFYFIFPLLSGISA